MGPGDMRREYGRRTRDRAARRDEIGKNAATCRTRPTRAGRQKPEGCSFSNMGA